MGIRFLCPQGHKLHVKSFLAGRRGICPHCGKRFYIPHQSTPDLRVTEVPQKAKPQGVAASAAAMATKASQGQSTVQQGSTEQAGTTSETGTNQSAGLWYVRGTDGEQYGPATDQVMHRWVEEQRVTADAMVWREGWGQWERAGDVLEPGSKPIGSEFDFDPNWLQPAGRANQHVADEEKEGIASLAAAPAGRRFRGQKKSLVLVLVVAVIVIAPIAIFVLFRTMSGS